VIKGRVPRYPHARHFEFKQDANIDGGNFALNAYAFQS